MFKKLVVLIALLIGALILLQVPVISDVADSFKADVTEKVDNVKEEVDRVKDKVDETKKNIEEIQEKIEETKENISAFAKWMQETKEQIEKAVASIQSMVGKLTSLFGDEEPLSEQSSAEAPAEPSPDSEGTPGP